MPRTPGPLFSKLIRPAPSDDLLLRRIAMHSAPSTTHSYGGTPCREWQRSTRGGFGRSWNGVRQEDNHRIVHRIVNGPIPEGHHVLHYCDNPPCSEPSHLWTGTVADNMADKMRKGRGGHEKMRGSKRGPSPQRGTKHPKVKITEAEVLAIRALPTTRYTALPVEFTKPGGGINWSAVARHYQISDSLARGIIARRNWAWLR